MNKKMSETPSKLQKVCKNGRFIYKKVYKISRPAEYITLNFYI